MSWKWGKMEINTHKWNDHWGRFLFTSILDTAAITGVFGSLGSTKDPDYFCDCKNKRWFWGQVFATEYSARWRKNYRELSIRYIELRYSY